MKYSEDENLKIKFLLRPDPYQFSPESTKNSLFEDDFGIWSDSFKSQIDDSSLIEKSINSRQKFDHNIFKVSIKAAEEKESLSVKNERNFHIIRSFENIWIGKQMEIYISKVLETCKFYFYLKTEMEEVHKFLQDLNKSYIHDKQVLKSDELQLNKEVVIYNDENFCRGRIFSKKIDTYQIFLFDFGCFALKKPDEIYKLKMEYKKRQQCVYEGNCNEIKNPDDIKNGFFHITVIGIRQNKTIDLKFK